MSIFPNPVPYLAYLESDRLKNCMSPVQFRMMEEACKFHTFDAMAFLHSNHRETDLYLEGARIGNRTALDKVANWYRYDRSRIDEETWNECADVIEKIRRRW